MIACAGTGPRSNLFRSRAEQKPFQFSALHEPERVEQVERAVLLLCTGMHRRRIATVMAVKSAANRLIYPFHPFHLFQALSTNAFSRNKAGTGPCSKLGNSLSHCPVPKAFGFSHWNGVAKAPSSAWMGLCPLWATTQPHGEDEMAQEPSTRPVRDELLKARVSRQIKQQLKDEAAAQGLSPAEAVRQAVAAWLKQAKRAA